MKLCQSLQTERIWGLAKALRFARPSIGFTRALRGGLRFLRKIFGSRLGDCCIGELELEVTCLLQRALCIDPATFSLTANRRHARCLTVASQGVETVGAAHEGSGLEPLIEKPILQRNSFVR